MSDTEVKKQEGAASSPKRTRGEKPLGTKQGAASRGSDSENGPKNSDPPTPAATSNELPETLREAVQTCINKIGHVVNQKKLGDLLAIKDQLEKFLRIGHPILDRFCVPVSAEQEAAAQRQRMKPDSK